MNSCESIEITVRAKPVQSVGMAIAAGFVLSRLPVAGILGLAIRVALSLIRPALLVLGGVKAWDLIQSRQADLTQAAPENKY